MAFAEAMGKLMQKQVEKIQDFADSIGDKPTPSDSTKLTAMTQMFQMFMNAVSPALKAMGEANASMARKQYLASQQVQGQQGACAWLCCFRADAKTTAGRGGGR